MMTQGQLLAAAYGAHPIARNGAGLKVGPLRINWVYPASDGWVTITLLFGPIAAYTVRLIEWMVEEGLHRAGGGRGRLGALPVRRAGRQGRRPEELDHLQERIAAFTGSHTKAELLAGALDAPGADGAGRHRPRAARQRPAGRPRLLGGGRRDPLPGPLRHRGWRRARAWRRSAPAPSWASTPPRCSTPCPSAPPPGRAPRTDGSRSESTSNRREAGDAERRRPLPAPLAGIKVADLTWYMAGPATTRMMADWGATVVRVESVSRPDGGRGSGPFPRGKSDPDAGGYGLTHNSGKLGLALDLSKPDSRPVLEDLLRWADVAVVNYSPRATRNLRLDWASLSELNPRADPGEHLSDGPVRPAGRVRRVRQPLRRHRRLLRGRRLARPPAGRAPTSPTPTWSPPASRSAPSSPRSTSAAAPAAVATSTSPRPRRRCGCSLPTSSTTS